MSSFTNLEDSIVQEDVVNGGIDDVLFAIPKKGRLHDECLKLLAGADLKYDRPARVDVATCREFPIKLVFLPAADIPSYVGEGNCDLGITGVDVVMEKDEDDGNEDIALDKVAINDEFSVVETKIKLGFGKCKLCVQAPVQSNIKSPSELAGKRIVTSFPNLTRKYFRKIEKNLGLTIGCTKIRYVSGSVEAACGLGLADGVVDLVETGTTMKAAGLEIVSNMITTEAVIIGPKNDISNNALNNDLNERQKTVNLILKRIRGYMTATNYLMISYNITKKLLSTAQNVTPGKRAPTVSSLDVKPGEPEAVAVSALVSRKQSSNIMDNLEEIGATDILVVSISNSRM